MFASYLSGQIFHIPGQTIAERPLRSACPETVSTVSRGAASCRSRGLLQRCSFAVIWLRRFRLAFLRSRRKMFWSPTCFHVLVPSFPTSFSSPSPFLTLLLLNWNAVTLPLGFPATIPGHLALCSSEPVPSTYRPFPLSLLFPLLSNFLAWEGRDSQTRGSLSLYSQHPAFVP